MNLLQLLFGTSKHATQYTHGAIAPRHPGGHPQLTRGQQSINYAKRSRKANGSYKSSLYDDLA